jgi:hypothetical protein
MTMGGFCEGEGQLYRWRQLTDEPLPEMLEQAALASDAPKEDEPSPEPNPLPTQGRHSSEPRILVTESEILDKSKDDALGKLFTLLQTTWFIVQYLERWVVHQPRTQLEVMTLAYAALNILVYTLWWDKPLNIQGPIDIHGRASAQISRTKGPRWLQSVLWEAFISTAPPNNVTHMSLPTVLPAVGILFGGVHCFAWRFPFPTGQEKMLWRVSAAYCTTSPLLIPLILLIDWAPHHYLPQRINLVLQRIQIPFKKIRDLLTWLGDLHPWIESITKQIPALITVILPTVLYVACRIILVVLTFTSLRAPPAGVYEATSWTSFLPHFG